MGRIAVPATAKTVTSPTDNRNVGEAIDIPKKQPKHDRQRAAATASRQQMTARVTEAAAPGSKNAGEESAQPARIENTHDTETLGTEARNTIETAEVAPVKSPGDGLQAIELPRKAAKLAPPDDLVRHYQPEKSPSQSKRILPTGVGISPMPEAAPSSNIRVTIGRVEIKAVRPPERPVQRAAPALKGPAVSLDAYLKGRDGGRQ